MGYSVLDIMHYLDMAENDGMLKKNNDGTVAFSDSF